MSTETANMETKATPEITRAAERYLEQYGDPLVINTYLKVTILVFAGVCVSLAGLTYKSQTALANMHPMIVRINDDTNTCSPSTTMHLACSDPGFPCWAIC